MSDLKSVSRPLRSMEGRELLNMILEIRRQRRAISEAALAKRQERATRPPKRKADSVVQSMTIEQIQEMLSKLRAPT